MTDADLLKKFRQSHSQQAFADLVKAHLDLAHSVARRCVRDDHLAEDITQAVFIILAEKAPSLPPNTNLAGWIFRTTQYVAANARRSLSAARAREQRYAETHPEIVEDVMNDPDAIAALERIMTKLSKPDQDALILKYYRNNSWQEVGAALGLSEDAARKRVERSLAKLKQYLPAALLAAAIPALLASKTVSAAPATLSNLVLSNFATATATNATTLTLAKGCLKMMKLSHMLHVSLYTFTALAVAGGIALFLMHGKTAQANASAPNTPIVLAATAEPALSPLDTVRLFAAAVKSGDEDAVKNLTNADTPQEKQVVALQAHMTHEVVLLQDAVKNKFGAAAVKQLPPLAGPLDIPADATETITGDTATVSLSGIPLPLVKINDQWKIAYHAIGMTNLPIASDVLIEWNKSLNTALDEITAEINDDHVADVNAVKTLLITKLTAVSKKLQESLSPPPATQTK